MKNLVKGICRLGVVAAHSKPDYNSLLFSEILFGEHYAVKSSFKDWLEIELAFDGSVGWINKDHHFQISDAYYDQINSSDYKVCTDLSGTIFFQKKYVNILLGSILPISSNELFKMEEQIAYNGTSKSLSQKRDIEFLKEIVNLYKHTPRRPGGKTPFGIDEGGFIQQVFKICGYQLPRELEDQSRGAQEKELSQLSEGDVIFLGEGSVKNALIYLGNDQYAGMIDGNIEKIGNLEFADRKVKARSILHKSAVSASR